MLSSNIGRQYARGVICRLRASPIRLNRVSVARRNSLKPPASTLSRIASHFDLTKAGNDAEFCTPTEMLNQPWVVLYLRQELKREGLWRLSFQRLMLSATMAALFFNLG